MKTKDLLEWVSIQNKPMYNLSTLEIEQESIATDKDKYDFFNLLFCAQPIGKVQAGFYAYMDFSMYDYQENRCIFADKEPDFVIIMEDVAVCFHRIEDIAGGE